MAIRIPWDEQEAALLVHACDNYNKGILTKKEAISGLSKTLRKRAENKGIEIDGVFRNENGITMQFMLMNELISEEKCGLRGASKLFVYMSDMFKNDRASFDKILEEENPLAVERSTKEQFYTWIEDKVSKEQLSDICIMCDEIEQYCFDKKTASYRLFGTTKLKKWIFSWLDKIEKAILQKM